MQRESVDDRRRECKPRAALGESLRHQRCAEQRRISPEIRTVRVCVLQFLERETVDGVGVLAVRKTKQYTWQREAQILCGGHRS